MDFRRKMREHLFFSEQCSLFKTSLTVTNFECFYFCSPGIKGYVSHPTMEQEVATLYR